MVYKWYTNGIQMVYKWYTNGIQMVYKWYTNGIQKLPPLLAIWPEGPQKKFL